MRRERRHELQRAVAQQHHLGLIGARLHLSVAPSRRRDWEFIMSSSTASGEARQRDDRDCNCEIKSSAAENPLQRGFLIASRSCIAAIWRSSDEDCWVNCVLNVERKPPACVYSPIIPVTAEKRRRRRRTTA